MYRILHFDWLAVRARRAYLVSLGFPDLLPQEGISIFGHIICSWKIFSHVLFKVKAIQNACDNHGILRFRLSTKEHLARSYSSMCTAF